MPDIGNTSQGAQVRAMDAVLRGIEITMPAGTFAAGVTISAYLNNPTGTEEWTAAVYGSGANNAALLAESSVRSNITGTALYTFSGGALASFTPSASTTYIIVIASESNADAEIYFDDGTGRNQSISQVNAINMTVEPMNSDARSYSVYMTYSNSAGGNVNLFAGKFAGKLVGKL